MAIDFKDRGGKKRVGVKNIPEKKHWPTSGGSVRARLNGKKTGR